MSGDRETIAIYSEFPIRTYGFSVRTGLTLLTLPPEADPAALEAILEQTVSLDAPLVLGAGIGAPDGAILLNLVVALGERARVAPGLPAGARIEQDVETVVFQGPHYGDRYGIAAAAFEALQAAQVDLLAAGFAGASVCLVVGAGQASATVTALRGSFYIPGEQGAPDTPDRSERPRTP